MLSPTVEVSWNLSRNDPCQTQRAGVDDPRAHLTSRKGIQLKELEHQAKFFDRWGLFIGLVPVVGDIVNTAFALMLIYRIKNIGLEIPRSVYNRMVARILLSAGIGLIPPGFLLRDGGAPSPLQQLPSAP
ncbi:uncharacterized protein N7473_011057 [Penicillium subrubescens]|uniref:uncharacterized protein n=1 Tax=Penicillium subrubescens TaxID=1316194 RepID=UPI00254536E2|nr:uncharacterized protein N7473_011161 [Penicillium subrubescens]XP_057004290.1 uncharacterized protein N7473_011057 [Penicillium subrubescens]KAJ5882727.1 hypothetical protein N7473_011161 [Penicillium subrubescens]KAJ5882795.1 hypothetical protein N7473_011057 [Penicillium subrubescens]